MYVKQEVGLKWSQPIIYSQHATCVDNLGAKQFRRDFFLFFVIKMFHRRHSCCARNATLNSQPYQVPGVWHFDSFQEHMLNVDTTMSRAPSAPSAGGLAAHPFSSSAPYTAEKMYGNCVCFASRRIRFRVFFLRLKHLLPTCWARSCKNCFVAQITRFVFFNYNSNFRRQ